MGEWKDLGGASGLGDQGDIEEVQDPEGKGARSVSGVEFAVVNIASIVSVSSILPSHYCFLSGSFC